MVGGITVTELHANMYPPSSLPATPQIPEDVQAASCNAQHLHPSQALVQSVSPSYQELCFLSAIYDVAFIPTSGASDVAAPSCPSMPLDPFHADWPHWDIPADRCPHPPPALSAPHL